VPTADVVGRHTDAADHPEDHNATGQLAGAADLDEDARLKTAFQLQAVCNQKARLNRA
jgi:hypothetical protein